MPSMTQAEISRARLGESPRREARVIQGMEQPAMEQIAKPQEVERSEPPPWEGIQPTSFILRQYEGDFQLPRGERAGGIVRPVTDGDIEEFMLWGYPRFVERHPRFTPEAAVGFARLAISSNDYRAIRTDNAFGLFWAARTPWEPLPTVIDIGVVARKEDHPNQHKGVEVLRIYRAGLQWAIELKAVEYRFVSDCGYNLDPIAKRLEMDADKTLLLYRKKLR